MNLNFIHIEPEAHQMPGLGLIEYIYCRELNELTINMGGQQVACYYGDEAFQLYRDLVVAGEAESEEEKQVLRMINDAFNLTITQLKQRTRKREIVQVRQLGMWWLKNNSKLSLAAIGGIFGGFDHATVLHACKTVDNLRETNVEFRVCLNVS